VEIVRANEGLTNECRPDEAIAASNEAPLGLSRKRDVAEQKENGGENDPAQDDEDGRQSQGRQRCAQLYAFGSMTGLMRLHRSP
jgi:hypothetical protein